ncbi:hypothetical protein L9F63_018895, partial [Diploptera punctata]
KQWQYCMQILNKKLSVGEEEVVGVSSSLLTAVKLAAPENCCSGPVGPTNLLALESNTRDAETITDVCSGGELPEVEIISLLEEQIPRYRLRADALTQFTGYENEDWYIPSPALKPTEVDLKLTPEQIREVLNYFPTWRGDLAEKRITKITEVVLSLRILAVLLIDITSVVKI